MHINEHVKQVLKALNPGLSNLTAHYYLINTLGWTLIDQYQSNDYFDEKDQSEVGERWVVYRPKDLDLLIKVSFESDSYGTEHFTGIQFVEEKLKTVKVYDI